jgi:hypothetical protein
MATPQEAEMEIGAFVLASAVLAQHLEIGKGTYTVIIGLSLGGTAEDVVENPIGAVVWTGPLLLLASVFAVWRAIDWRALREQKPLPKRVSKRWSLAEATAARTVFEDEVDFAIYSPASVAPNDELVVQVALHPMGEESAATSLAEKSDAGTSIRAQGPLSVRLSRGTEVRIRLLSERLDIYDPVQTLTWVGRPAVSQFAARSIAKRGQNIAVSAVVSLADGTPIGHASFLIVTKSPGESVRPDTRTDLAIYKKVFVSYSSKDRPRVLEHSLILRKVGMDVFQDVLDLEPGERWEKKLFKKIDEADLFLLYWSEAAASSSWVQKEAEYALARQESSVHERPKITPVLLEGPPPPKPPEALRAIHFDDPLEYVLAAISHQAQRP